MYGIDQRTNAPTLAPGDVVYLVYVVARSLGLGEAVCCLFLPLADFANIEARHELLHGHICWSCQSAGDLTVRERKLMPPGVRTVSTGCYSQSASGSHHPSCRR